MHQYAEDHTTTAHTTAPAAQAPSLAASQEARDFPWRGPSLPGMGSAGRDDGNAEQLDLARYFALYHGGPKAEALAETMRPDASKHEINFTLASARVTEVFRRRLIPKAAELLGPLLKQGELKFVTIIPQESYFSLGKLHLADPRVIVRRLKRRIGSLMVTYPASRFGIFIGMLEVKIRLDKKAEPHGYQLHIHAICDAAMMQVIEALPRRRFGSGPSRVGKPIECWPVRTVAEIQRRLGYITKAQAQIWRPYATTSNSTGDSGPVLQREPPGDLTVEPLLWISRWKISDLVLVMGTIDLRASMTMRWRGRIMAEAVLIRCAVNY